MLNNLLYLIDTNTSELTVTLYIMTVNKNGQLILRFVQEVGKLSEIKNFYTEDAYVAVKEVEYQAETSEFVKSILPSNLSSSYVVSAVVNGENSIDTSPFGIFIFGNEIKLSIKDKKPVNDNTFIVLAALNYAKVKAQNSVMTIITGDSKNCRFYEFELTPASKDFNISTLTIEPNVVLYNMPLLNRITKKSIMGYDIIRYDRIIFGSEWKKRILASMDDFYLSCNDKLIPRFDGSWSNNYIEGLSFPYLKYFKDIPTKIEWLDFLKNDKWILSDGYDEKIVS